MASIRNVSGYCHPSVLKKIPSGGQCIYTGYSGQKILQAPSTWVDSTALVYETSLTRMKVVAVLRVKGHSQLMCLPQG
jgi:hypothetical protein